MKKNSAPTSPVSSQSPKHWQDPKELSEKYWSDSKNLEDRSTEFLEKPFEALGKMAQTGFARRQFLAVMGASAAMASFSCARRPVNKILPYVVKPEEITPGVANWYASTCGECSSGCGILIKNREARPIKLEGNPDHPMNKGKLCSRGQASLLNLYDPDRYKSPESNGDHKDWADVNGKITGKLRNQGHGSGRVRVLTGPVRGGSERRLLDEFVSAFSEGKLVEYEPLSLDDLVEAQKHSYGTPVVPRYRFDEARVILSLGADFLGTWGFPVEHSRQWAERRKLQDKSHQSAELSKVFCFESTVTITGSSADERFAVRPGDEFKIAMAVAHELIITGNKSQFSSNESLQSLLKGYSAKKVADEIGGFVTQEKIREVASALWEAKGSGLVVGGSPYASGENAVALQVVINLLNSALQNEGKTVEGTVNPSTAHGSFKEVRQLVRDMHAGKVDFLIIHDSNPVYTLPPELKFADALKKVDMVVSVTDRRNETSRLCHFTVPCHHYLENWGDASPRDGIYSLQQPALSPIHDTRSFQDLVLNWIHVARLKPRNANDLASSIVASGKESHWYRYLRANWKDTVHRWSGSGLSFEEFWDASLQKGVVNLVKGRSAGPRSFRESSLSELPQNIETLDSSSNDDSLFLMGLYLSPGMGDGRSANNAWLQELPDPISTATWDNFLNIAPSTAKKLHLTTNDVVKVASGDTIVEIPVYVQPGMHPKSVTVSVGYGRTWGGRNADNTGVDAYPFQKLKGDRLYSAGFPVTVTKTGKRYELAITLGHHRSEGRPILNDISLDAYKNDANAANHTNPHLKFKEVPTLWPKHEYKGHRWGMAIDLNACNGCNACVIACQAENNVPVVGRDSVRMSREMHWIRIDRYFSGSEDNPDVLFQPMLCQHCENASCESVCPVLATVHSSEGLNEMAYNRCVGTRYCQNNCPYKVRRFNFFDEYEKVADVQNNVWNPDVTVRMRGVMEKCSFCVQRIEKGKSDAKESGAKLKDGQIVSACEQTCPTDAIVFGDMNDPESRVAKLQGEQRAFRSLEFTNNKPSISYMSKVRNKTHVNSHINGHPKENGKGDSSGGGNGH